MKKNLIKVTIILSMLLLTLIPLSVNAAISGDGTEESPFLITNQEELELITNFPDCQFKLVNDIVINGYLTPLCAENESKTFTGVFDGNGHTISNLTINEEYIDIYLEGLALFYNNGGTIKNLNIETSSKGFEGNVVSGIAVNNYGTILNCSVSGKLTAFFSVCGVTTNNYGVVKKCKVSAVLKDGAQIGGIAIENGSLSGKQASITQCSVVGDYSSIHSYLEGIAGVCFRNLSEIENCYFIGTLTGTNLGGVSVYNGYYSSYIIDGEPTETICSDTISKCYVVSTFDYNTNVYPITFNKANSNSIIENCCYDKNVSGLNSTTYGTPQSTQEMKIIQTYRSNWDFDTV